MKVCSKAQKKQNRERKKMSDDDEPDFDPEDLYGSAEALNNLAKMGLTVFRAVLRDGGSHYEAFSVTSAFFAGFSKASAEE